MTFKIIIKPLAEEDITEAAEWYSLHADHLTSRFLKKIETAVEYVRNNPEHFQKRYKALRIIYIENFPYGIYYTIEKDTIFIHAVLHTKRDPGKGIGRI